MWILAVTSNHNRLNCYIFIVSDTKYVMYFEHLQSLLTCRMQNTLCFFVIFIFQIQYKSVYKPYQSSFVSVWLFLSSPGTFIFVRCICIHYNQIHQKLFQVFLLSVSLPSNDTFCHSKVFSISLPGLKEIDLKGLEQVKKCGLNSNSRIQFKG